MAAALIFSLWLDNHDLRLSTADLTAAKQRPLIERAATRWFDHVDRIHPPAGSEDRVIPLVIVATAGGASRAAYWTGTVLAALQEGAPKFTDHLFAISSVSGGSLGAAAFVVLAGKQNELVDPDLPEPKPKPMTVRYYSV